MSYSRYGYCNIQLFLRIATNPKNNSFWQFLTFYCMILLSNGGYRLQSQRTSSMFFLHCFDAHPTPKRECSSTINSPCLISKSMRLFFKIKSKCLSHSQQVSIISITCAFIFGDALQILILLNYPYFCVFLKSFRCVLLRGCRSLGQLRAHENQNHALTGYQR